MAIIAYVMRILRGPSYTVPIRYVYMRKGVILTAINRGQLSAAPLLIWIFTMVLAEGAHWGFMIKRHRKCLIALICDGHLIDHYIGFSTSLYNHLWYWNYVYCWKCLSNTSSKILWREFRRKKVIMLKSLLQIGNIILVRFYWVMTVVYDLKQNRISYFVVCVFHNHPGPVSIWRCLTSVRIPIIKIR